MAPRFFGHDHFTDNYTIKPLNRGCVFDYVLYMTMNTLVALSQCMTNDNIPFVYFSNTLGSVKNIYHRISLYARASVTQGRNGMFSKQRAWKH